MNQTARLLCTSRTDAAGRRLLLRSLAAALAAAMALTTPVEAGAQAYPSQPVKLVAPFPPGGGADVISRLFAQQMTAAMGQPFVVENKPGAGTLLAASLVAKSPADGYTLMTATADTLAVASTLFQNPPAISSAQRLSLAGEVPTVVELGYPGFEALSWMGFAAPLGTPKAIIERLHAGIREAAETPELSRRLRDMGLDPIVSASPEAFASYAAQERARWSALIKATGIEAN